MATIAAIHSKLTLNTRNFRTGLDKAQARVGQFTKRARSGINTVGKYGIAMGAAALAGGTLLVKQQMAAIDSSAKFADTIGISTEALAGYRHGADLTGTAQATLEKGLQRLTRNMGDARNGVAAAIAGFEQIGISADALGNMTTEEALLGVADAIKAQPDAASKASAAFAIFGRQGQELLTFLEQGSEGIRANADEAERLGLTYSRIDAAKVEAANDAITRLKAIGTGATQTLAIELAPVIEAVATKLTSAGTSGQSMGSMVLTAVEWVARAIAKASGVVEVLQIAFKGVQLAVVRVAQFSVDTFGKLEAMVFELLASMLRGAAKLASKIPGIGKDIAAGLEAAASGADFAVTVQDNLSSSLDAVGDGLQAELDEMWLAPTAEDRVTQWFADVRAAAETNAEALANNANAADVASGSMEEMFDQLEQDAKNAEKVVESLADLDKQLSRFGMDDTAIKLADLGELGATNEQLDQAREKLEQIARLTRNAERQQAIGDIVGDLEQQVRTFNLTDAERQILDLEALGASDEQIAKAKSALDELARLEAERTGGPTDRTPADPASLVRVGSAEAQRLAFQASRGQTNRDDTPKKQLQTQERMARTLERIEANRGAAGEEGWDI